MPTWYYFARPNHLAFHDFTTDKTPPKNLRSLLGLGLKFIPTPRYTNSWQKIRPTTFDRFKRSLHLKFHFATTDNNEEKDEEKDEDDYNPRMYVKSHWTPPPWTWPRASLDDRLESFDNKLATLFRRRKGKTNLLPYQHRALCALQSQKEFLIVPCDKNLGPAIIQTEEYIRLAFRDHLNCTATYKRLSAAETTLAKARMRTAISDWLKRNKIYSSKMERKFLRKNLNENEDPFGRFYLTLKAHKLKPGDPVSALKSRPIVSCPGSLLHPMGVWTDSRLQEVAKQQASYFPNSFELKKQLLELDLPPNARLFTADAVSMYTNIPTNLALNLIGQRLQRYSQQHPSYPAKAVRESLRLVMTNNVFTFGDMTFRQLNGTAMGTPPAPPYATLYYGTFENNFLPDLANCLPFYRRFIDDVLGVYLCHPDPETDARQWQDLINAMNQAPGLTWEFSKPSQQVDFMDLTLRIENGKIVTTLYEKPLNLHLYIPPHSAHPPGLLPGIVFGNLFRIYTLCSNEEDCVQRTKVFYQRLKARGYKPEQIKPIFERAIERAKVYTGQMDRENEDDPYVIFHLQYHPDGPASSKIQQAWKELVAEPKYRMPIWNVQNPSTKKKCGLRRMIIAYSRPMNLGNLLSHRIFEPPANGPPVSAHYEPRDM